MTAPTCLTDWARAALAACDPAEKIRITRAALAAGPMPLGAAGAPDRPGRPQRPQLTRPNALAKRRALTKPEGRAALLHALAHIELNAIDLGWDLVARFADPSLPRGVFDDWAQVAAEEADHFELLATRMADFGCAYGDLPAHDGLWEAAQATADDLLARLAVAPMVLEARGLDVTLPMADRLEAAGDPISAALVRRIHEEEIGHVAAGARWFEAICAARGLDPAPTWRDLVAKRFKGALKPPFNLDSRRRAGFDPARYLVDI